jgi:hypothetical protein
VSCGHAAAAAAAASATSAQRAAVGGRGDDARGRLRRIEQHGQRAGLQRAEQRRDEASRAFDADDHRRFGAHAAQRERMGDAVRRVVEFGERQRRRCIGERDAMRIRGRLPRERGDHVGMLDAQPRPSRGWRDAGDASHGSSAVTVCGSCAAHATSGIAVEPRARGVGVDAVGRIGGDERDAARIVGEVEREVEARGEIRPGVATAVAPGNMLSCRASNCWANFTRSHSSPRRTGGFTASTTLERHVLVRDRVERGRARRLDERAERLRRRDPHAQRDGVQEQAEQAARFLALTMRDRHRDDHVGLARQAREPCVERGQQHGEHGGLRIAREPAQVGRDRVRQAHGHARAPCCVRVAGWRSVGNASGPARRAAPRASTRAGARLRRRPACRAASPRSPHTGSAAPATTARGARAQYAAASSSNAQRELQPSVIA